MLVLLDYGLMLVPANVCLVRQARGRMLLAYLTSMFVFHAMLEHGLLQKLRHQSMFVLSVMRVHGRLWWGCFTLTASTVLLEHGAPCLGTRNYRHVLHVMQVHGLRFPDSLLITPFVKNVPPAHGHQEGEQRRQVSAILATLEAGLQLARQHRLRNVLTVKLANGLQPCKQLLTQPVLTASKAPTRLGALLRSRHAFVMAAPSQTHVLFGTSLSTRASPMLDVGGAWDSVGLECRTAHPSLHRHLSVTVIRTPGSMGLTPITARLLALTA